MNPQVSSIVDVILDRSPEELIGGVLMALVLALGLSGLFHLIRRKVSDTSTLIICLALSSNLIAMTVAGAFVRYKFTGGRPSARAMRSAEPQFAPPGMHGGRSGFIAGRILEEADLNGDGSLSSDEAVFAAARFVKESGDGEDGPLNEHQLRAAIWSRLGHSHGMMGMDWPPPPAERPPAIGKGRNRHRREDGDRSPH